MTCSPGALGQLFTKDGSGDQTHAWTDLDDFISEDLVEQEAYVGGDFIRGTRSRDINQLRLETGAVGGSAQLPWSRHASEKWPKRFLGGGSTPTYTCAETLPTFFTCIRKNATPTNHEYINCKVASATLSGTRGGPVILDAQIVGTTQTTNTDAALDNDSYSDTYQPYILNDAVLTINGSAYAFRTFAFTVDNFIETDFTNSLTATDNCPQDRLVTMSIDGKQGDLEALYSVDYSSGVAVSIVLTNSNGYTSTISGTKFVYEKRTASIPGRSTILLPIQGTFYANKAGGDKEVTFVTGGGT